MTKSAKFPKIVGSFGFIHILETLINQRIIYKEIIHMAGKIFDGNVSVYKNTNNKIMVEPDNNGSYNNGNADELVKVMSDLGKTHKAEVNFFIPDDLKNTDKSTLNALILQNRWGKPYVAFLPALKEGTKRATKEKLA